MLLFLVLTAGPALAGGAEAPAETSATGWLVLVDKGRFSEAWEKGATVFRNGLTREAWLESVTPVREALGRLEERSLLSATPATSMPRGPKGEYLVLKFEARFAAGVSMTETVTTVKDPDGSWRVAGYFVR